ncbi:glycosyltransferase family 4 protein [Enterococcus casseliflavus]|uniref:glycosyltransferase n=1 Tax=Enterococcus TaxID=1350 RepID=UPI001432A785|nr:glycosyltransferase [Enterococcus casseliflavus]NKD37696.1 glycosyltransferase family 4 protein [Enterococcus casseliflavus]
MKKILLVITGMPLGGAERVMATIANSFSEKYSVTLVSLKKMESKYELNEKVNYITTNGRVDKQTGVKRKFQLIRSGISSIFELKKIIEKENPDIILSFLDNANYIVSILKKLFFKDKEVVISERNDVSQNSKLSIFIKKNLYKEVDTLICQTDFVGNYYINEMNIDKEKISIIPNPLNMKAIYLGEIKKENAKKIVAVGRLHKQKNYLLLLESFKIFSDKYPNYILEIYGEGPEREKLTIKIEELDLSNKVILKGTLKNPFLQIYDSSMYIMTSIYEGYPNALMEAMASGLPVICTNLPNGVSKELIANGFNGYTVEYNSKELFYAMEKIILDSDKSLNMKLNNRESALNRFNEKKILDIWEKILIKDGI